MTWAVHQVKDHRFGLALVRAESEQEALDKFYGYVYREARRLGLRAPAKSSFSAVPSTKEAGE